MKVKTIDGKIVELKDVGDAISASEKYITLHAQIKKLQAQLAEKQALADAYLVEAKKQSIADELTYEEKKILIMSGVKKPKDFPGDDWSGVAVVGENGV